MMFYAQIPLGSNETTCRVEVELVATWRTKVIACAS